MINYILYGVVGLVVFFILYQKGIIFADFEFIDPKVAVEIIENEENNMTILDVRTKEEYKNEGHIKNAILIPVQELKLEIQKLEKFKSRKIIVYCASGNRSVAASRILKENGFTPYNVNGGITRYKKEGFKVQK